MQRRPTIDCVRALLLILGGASRALGGDVGVADLEAVLGLYPAAGDVALPALTAGEMQALADGDSVVRVTTARQAESGEQVGALGVVGLRIVDAPRLLVWLTVMGVASEPDVRLTRSTLSRGPLGAYTRYQHVDLPWPIRDRHWVVFCEKNLAVAEASGGGYWEHRWRLVENGPALIGAAHRDGRIAGLRAEKLEKSVYLPANRGAWTLTELAAGRTLVIAYFDGELGGLFPDALVRQFTRLHLKEGLDLVAALSLETWREYGEDTPVHDGYGRAVRQDDVLAAVRLLGALPLSAGD